MTDEQSLERLNQIVVRDNVNILYRSLQVFGNLGQMAVMGTLSGLYGDMAYKVFSEDTITSPMYFIGGLTGVMAIGTAAAVFLRLSNYYGNIVSNGNTSSAVYCLGRKVSKKGSFAERLFGRKIKVSNSLADLKSGGSLDPVLFIDDVVLEEHSGHWFDGRPLIDYNGHDMVAGSEPLYAGSFVLRKGDEREEFNYDLGQILPQVFRKFTERVGETMALLCRPSAEWSRDSLINYYPGDLDV